ncbi:NAD(P)-binding protein [Pelagicoccus sp. SDUM812002]|uniref:NAD(P)/FAD-dependent oxidoreductase n=1 Tax=Pelagicoccus sp. SDUM812002 TaxID=3041266 RepID=UPI00281063A6|nr:NAD(P)-binding protein [Pelagicoccus sp. SDUM812002]MDQ8186761.1 NAD(P)-binding protein [Pelagicoccus sp. SDUM812002]
MVLQDRLAWTIPDGGVARRTVMRKGVRTIKIVGGGLAGLSLGIALRRHDVPVAILEAGRYPRHKVCGEFIAGLSKGTMEKLGIVEELADAIPHRNVAWLLDGKVFRRDRLPSAALGISRHLLDQRLALLFQDAGGQLETKSRVSDRAETREGWVWATGRRREGRQWIGLKAHCEGLGLESDLEVHLAENAYVGASCVEDGRVNVCGLFRCRGFKGGGRQSILVDSLRASGLDQLAQRLVECELDVESASSVAGLGFGVMPKKDLGLRIGDAFALIPPFTGDGMAMAFEGAADALYPVLRYARGELSWIEAERLVDRCLRRRFRRRLATARAMHPFLYRRMGQAAFRISTSSRLLPFERIFQLLHT